MQDLQTTPPKEQFSADRLISDIEFELAQGVVSTDDLGRAIQAVKQYQNKARSELFRSPRINRREFAAHSFQSNDMLITLLQETVGRIQQMQAELREMRRVSALSPQVRASLPSETGEAGGTSLDTGQDSAMSGRSVTDPHEGSLAELEAALHAGRLDIELDARPITIPIVSALLTRIRNALHSLPLFYVRRLASKQAAINHVYGDWLLHLYHLYCQQRDEIAALNKLLAQLRQEGSRGGVDPTTP